MRPRRAVRPASHPGVSSGSLGRAAIQGWRTRTVDCRESTMASAGTWVKRVVLGALGLVLVVIVAAVGFLLYKQIPQNLSGWAAKAVCSGVFVAGRDPDVVYDEDVVGVHAIFKPVSVDIDESSHSVTARTAGLFARTATLQPDRGCVLDLPPNAAAEPYVPDSATTTPWPQGDQPLDAADWPAGVDAAALNEAVDDAFVGAGDIAAANARGVAVVQDGELLVLREAPGFENGTALHGWSMTKTVAGMLAYKLLAENNVALDTPVVDAFQAGREPAWVADWRADDRSRITVRQIFGMTDGLANVEGYTPLADTVRHAQRRTGHGRLRGQRPGGVPARIAVQLHQPDGQHPGRHLPGPARHGRGVLGLSLQGALRPDRRNQRRRSRPTPQATGSAPATSGPRPPTGPGSDCWGSRTASGRARRSCPRAGSTSPPPRPCPRVRAPATARRPGSRATRSAASAGTSPGSPRTWSRWRGTGGRRSRWCRRRTLWSSASGWTFDSDQFDFCTFWNDTLAALPTP